VRVWLKSKHEEEKSTELPERNIKLHLCMTNDAAVDSDSESDAESEFESDLSAELSWAEPVQSATIKSRD